MKHHKQRLILDHCDRKLESLTPLKGQINPPSGWINTIRTALGMSLRQLGKRIGRPAQSIQDFEKRETNGTITLQSLMDIAEALDMKLVYALVPKTGSLEDLVLKQAHAKAEEIISRTNTTMQLEGQGNSTERLKDALNEKTAELNNEMPKFLWD